MKKLFKDPCFQKLMDIIDVSIYCKDAQGVYLFCNHYMMKMAGISDRDEIIEKTDSDLPWKDIADDLHKIDQGVIDGKGTVSVEELPRLFSKESRAFSTTKSPIINGSGDVDGLIGVSIDITDKKQLEKEREEVMEKLAVANQVKDEFIANMSHDLRTPMTGLMGMIQEMGYIGEDIREAIQQGGDAKAALAKIDEVSKTIQKVVSIAEASTDELLNLFNEVIATIRLESGQIESTIEPFSLRDTLQKSMDLLKPTANDKNIQLSAVIDASVPEQFTGNRRFLDRILINLISNALKFTPEGQVIVSCQFNNHHRDPEGYGNLTIVVEDTGIGIPEDKFDEIFEHFSRLTSSYSGVYKGYGLGLYAVKKYVEMMNGKITVESTLGKGSQFTLTLPMQVNAETTLADTSLLAAHILLVEDDGATAFQLIKSLKGVGCTVERAETSDRAETLFNEQVFDLMLVCQGIKISQKNHNIKTITYPKPIDWLQMESDLRRELYKRN